MTANIFCSCSEEEAGLSWQNLESQSGKKKGRIWRKEES
jgi:hypothetical protein